MDVTDSVAVRWFVRAEHPLVPAAIRCFGEMAGEARSELHFQTGSDHVTFVVTAAQPRMIQLRSRVQTLGAHMVASNVIGKLDVWRTIVLRVDDPDLIERGRWIGIRAERRRLDIAPGRDCTAELAQLRCTIGERTTTQWTLAVEALGPAEHALELLKRSCERLFSQLQVELPFGTSRSYPPWLALAR